MDKTKIVTFRLQEDLLTDLDEFVKTHYYWKRSFIIVAIIWAFFRLASAGTRFNIIRIAFQKNPKLRIKLEEIEPNNENPEN